LRGADFDFAGAAFVRTAAAFCTPREPRSAGTAAPFCAKSTFSS
jgi:hypothetical protein